MTKMRVLFCKVSNMKYYKGACNDDIAKFGGSFVEENGYGHEEFNFLPIYLDESEEATCLGFVEPKSKNGVRNTFHIEKIEGCKGARNEEFVENVLVIWCCQNEKGTINVIGWYKNATVYRRLQDFTMIFENGVEEERCYNVKAATSDCVLLPVSVRNRQIWWVPYSKNQGYGYGSSFLWYPTNPEAQKYLQNMIDNIENYSGANWINEYPDYNK